MYGLNSACSLINRQWYINPRILTWSCFRTLALNAYFSPHLYPYFSSRSLSLIHSHFCIRNPFHSFIPTKHEIVSRYHSRLCLILLGGHGCASTARETWIEGLLQARKTYAVSGKAETVPVCWVQIANGSMHRYWIPKEGDKDMTNDGDSVTLSGPKTKKLKTKDGKTIAKVSEETLEVKFARKIMPRYFVYADTRYNDLEIRNGRHWSAQRWRHGQSRRRQRYFSEGQPQERSLRHRLGG